jgi:hypothetical protein
VIDLIRDIKQDKRQEGRKKDVSAAHKKRITCRFFGVQIQM